MTHSTTELNALIGSRICHDLISPLGAIGNGVELLSMSGVTAAPEITLISESVENANARIRFFRVAFGAASKEAQIGHSEVTRVLSDLYRGNRIRVDWRISGDTLRLETKLVFLLIQCFESALPWGGKVVVTRTGDTWSIYGSADRMKVQQELWDRFESGDDGAEIVPSNVHFALVKLTADAIGRSAKASVSEAAISVSF